MRDRNPAPGIRSRHQGAALLIVTTVALLLALSFFLQTQSPAFAQTPSSWQTEATGLTTSSNPGQKTASLAVIVRAAGTPFLSLQGGVKQGGGGIVGPTTIELGEVKVPGTIHTLTSESADWAHDELTFTNGLKLWVSRLSPAVLIQAQDSRLRLLSGAVAGATSRAGTVANRTASPSSPKYLAYSSDGSIQVSRLSTGDLTLPPLDQGWMLLWYGNNSHFVDTKAPTSYSVDLGSGFVSLPDSQGYQADAPILLKFENRPSSIRQSPEGGVELTFNGASGSTALMPLLGIDHPKAQDTEAWSEGLPSDIASKINFWSGRLGSYPTGVAEGYSYDAATDTATISESISYTPIDSTGTSLAILPPTLALAMEGGNPLGISVSGSVVDPGYPTEFGPVRGIDNAGSYSWSITGLGRYADGRRTVTGTGQAPPELQEELTQQVQRLTSSGHLKPWLFSDELPRHPTRGDIYFLNPADSLYHLVEVAQAMPDSPERDNLVGYIKSERSLYPPESVYNLPDEGALRTPFALDNYSAWQQQRPDLFLKRVPLYSFYGLSRYYDLTGEGVPSSLVDAAKVALSDDMSEQDWASFYWFKGFDLDHTAVVNSNRHLAGTIGLIRLAAMSGDSSTESLGRALLAKAAVQRLSMATYPRYLYGANLVSLPADTGWQPTYLARSWVGYIYNYDWSGPYDDARQVARLDQFGSYLYDTTGHMDPSLKWADWNFQVSAHLSAYRDMVPEVFRFLGDYAREDAQVYVDKVTAYLPLWYAGFTEAAFGAEHNLNHPTDSFQLFLAKALLQGGSPQQLENYLDVPWLDTGDLFYLQKLAETINAYRGTMWDR